MRWIRVVFLLMLAIAASTTGAERARAASYAQETLDRYFRVEFDVSRSSSRTTIGGYVYNQHQGYTADRVRLSIERLDASGQVVGTSSTWLLGGIPPSNRNYFSVRVEPAASYRVQVESFEWTGRGGGNN
jgi:hypothetical protein